MSGTYALAAAALARAEYRPSNELVRLMCAHVAHEARADAVPVRVLCAFLEAVAVLRRQQAGRRGGPLRRGAAAPEGADPEAAIEFSAAVTPVLQAVQAPFTTYLKRGHPHHHVVRSAPRSPSARRPSLCPACNLRCILRLHRHRCACSTRAHAPGSVQVMACALWTHASLERQLSPALRAAAYDVLSSTKEPLALELLRKVAFALRHLDAGDARCAPTLWRVCDAANAAIVRVPPLSVAQGPSRVLESCVSGSRMQAAGVEQKGFNVPLAAHYFRTLATVFSSAAYAQVHVRQLPRGEQATVRAPHRASPRRTLHASHARA